jgi:hypothetical protein
MTELRYPFSALVRDYASGSAGLALFVTLITVAWDSRLVWLFVGLTILFAIFTISTVAKHLARFRVSEEGIERGGFRRGAVRWGELSEMALRYYTLSRLRKKGYMTLTLKSKGKDGEATLEIESTLPGFSEIATRAAHAAKENKLMVDRVTADNLAAIGVAG